MILYLQRSSFLNSENKSFFPLFNYLAATSGMILYEVTYHL